MAVSGRNLERAAKQSPANPARPPVKPCRRFSRTRLTASRCFGLGFSGVHCFHAAVSGPFHSLYWSATRSSEKHSMSPWVSRYFRHSHRPSPLRPKVCCSPNSSPGPTSEIARRCDELTGPADGKNQNQLHQSRTLATVRDTLRPKGLSGELRAVGTMLATPAGVAKLASRPSAVTSIQRVTNGRLSWSAAFKAPQVTPFDINTKRRL